METYIWVYYSKVVFNNYYVISNHSINDHEIANKLVINIISKIITLVYLQFLQNHLRQYHFTIKLN